jgi:hypothetical protein
VVIGPSSQRDRSTFHTSTSLFASPVVGLTTHSVEETPEPPALRRTIDMDRERFFFFIHDVIADDDDTIIFGGAILFL